MRCRRRRSRLAAAHGQARRCRECHRRLRRTDPIGKINGKQVVTFSHRARQGRVRRHASTTPSIEEIDEIEEENPGVKFTHAVHQRRLHQGPVSISSMLAMVEGAILAVIVVFLFLRDWRATLISALAIPLSAIPTFWFMDLLGFTLNSLSLLALGLVAGVLVDDAIVEIENIVRHMRMGKIRLSGIDRRGRRDRPGGGRDHLLDRRGVPAGRPDAGHFRAVLQEFRPDRGRLGADLPGRRAHDHADDRGLFPEGHRPCRARRGLDDGPLHEGAALVARYRRVKAYARIAAATAAWSSRICLAARLARSPRAG